jgi:hypothetical protein
MKEDAVSKTDKEILEEKARTLGFAGVLIDRKLKEMTDIEKEMEKTVDAIEYNELAGKYNRAREEALARKHELVIYREAIGARFHKDMDRYYPVPDKKDFLPL